MEICSNLMGRYSGKWVRDDDLWHLHISVRKCASVVLGGGNESWPLKLQIWVLCDKITPVIINLYLFIPDVLHSFSFTFVVLIEVFTALIFF